MHLRNPNRLFRISSGPKALNRLIPDENRPNSNDTHLSSSAPIESPVVQGSTVSSSNEPVVEATVANASVSDADDSRTSTDGTPMGGIASSHPAGTEYTTQNLESLLRDLQQSQNLLRGTIGCLCASSVCTFLWITISGFVRWRASPLAIVVGAITGMTMSRLGRGMTPRYMCIAVFIAGLGIAVSLGVLQRRTVASHRESARHRQAVMSAASDGSAKPITNVEDALEYGAPFDEHAAVADRELVSAVTWRARDMFCVAVGLFAAYLLSPRRVTDDELTDILRV